MKVDDLDRHECIVGTSENWRFNVKGKEIVHRTSGRFRCNSGHAVIEACIAGLGVCQLPDFYVQPHLLHGTVELLLEDVQPNEEPIWAVYPRRRHLIPKIQLAVDWLRRDLSAAMRPPVVIKGAAQSSQSDCPV